MPTLMNLLIRHCANDLNVSCIVRCGLMVSNASSIIYPDEVRLNLYYLQQYSIWMDLKMIFATVLGRKIEFGGEEI